MKDPEVMTRSRAKTPLVIYAVAVAVLGICGIDSYAQLEVPFYTKTQLGHAVAVQVANQQGLLASAGVLGVGVGQTNGSLAITILVDNASRTNELPAMLDDVPVTIQVVGAIHAFACGGSNPQLAYPLPVPLGVSGGNVLLAGEPGSCASGTIGFKVRDNVTGAIGWVSNSHVVSHGADGCPGTAPIGTPQFQPSGRYVTSMQCWSKRRHLGPDGPNYFWERQ